MFFYINHSKMRAVLAVGILVPQLFLIGCAKDNTASISQDDSQGYQPFRVHADSEARAREKAKNGQVRCVGNSSEDCNSAVGMLTMVELPSEVSMCTAFLVAPRIAMTNSHCIPDDLKAAGSNCANRMWLHFPELQGHSQARVGCSRVLTLSQDKADNPIAPDYAVIELDQAVNRPPLKISREGFKDNSLYQLVKVNPKSISPMVGELTRQICQAKHNSILVPDSNEDQSSNMTFGDCEVRQGNSGSPLLDSEGNVSGLIQITVDSAELKKRMDEHSLPVLDNQLVAPLGIGTSLSCLNLPSETQAPALPAQCASQTSTSIQQSKISGLMIGKLSKDLLSRLRQASLDNVYRWTMVGYQSSAHRFNFVSVPVCVQDVKTLLSRHRGWFGRYDSDVKQDVNLQYSIVTFALNRYLAFDYRVDQSMETVPGILRFSASSLSKDASMKVEVDVRSNTGEMLNLFGYTLKPCAQ
jgi:hypothetical protein